jgi:hypothetical protein
LGGVMRINANYDTCSYVMLLPARPGVRYVVVARSFQ